MTDLEGKARFRELLLLLEAQYERDVALAKGSHELRAEEKEQLGSKAKEKTESLITEMKLLKLNLPGVLITDQQLITDPQSSGNPSPRSVRRRKQRSPSSPQSPRSPDSPHSPWSYKNSPTDAVDTWEREPTLKETGENFHHCCFTAWAKHVALMNSMESFQLSGEYLQDGSSSAKSLSRRTASRSLTGIVPHEKSENGQEESRKYGLSQLMISPNSWRRLLWEVLGAFFLLWDSFALPLSAFGMDDLEPFAAMEWVKLLYWTADVPTSLLTGYFENGGVILSPRLVLRRYLRGWFILDLLVLLPDWVTAIVKLTGDASTLETLLLLRFLRVLRLGKGTHIFETALDMITSEKAFVIIKIALQIVSILVVSQIIAAIWYTVGKSSAIWYGRSWILDAELSEAEPFHLYLTAVHWTLTQFTPASMDVHAQNATERIFNICIILLGLCVFSAFVSSITTGMTQLANISSAQSQQLWVLRKYLKHHHIEGSLHFQILRDLERSYQQDASLPKNVLALQRLSEKSRAELLVTISMSCLQAHPLFEAMSQLLHSVAVLSSSLRDCQLAAEDLRFVDSTQAQSMDCPQRGSIAYCRFATSSFLETDDYLEIEIVENGGWLSEAALWTAWFHVGSAKAREECSVISVVPSEFRRTMREDLKLLKLSSHYAREFVRMLQERCRRGLSDTLKGSVHMASVHMSMLENVGQRASGKQRVL